jgi:hypothetical protein
MDLAEASTIKNELQEYIQLQEREISILENLSIHAQNANAVRTAAFLREVEEYKRRITIRIIEFKELFEAEERRLQAQGELPEGVCERNSPGIGHQYRGFIVRNRGIEKPYTGYQVRNRGGMYGGYAGNGRRY